MVVVTGWVDENRVSFCYRHIRLCTGIMTTNLLLKSAVNRIGLSLKIEKISYIHFHIPLNIHRHLFCHFIGGSINRSLDSNFYYSP